MGCDIHPYAEVRRDGVWHLVTDEVFPALDKFTNDGKPFTPWPFDERFYTMFGLFAGVRDTDVPSISEPRGLPEDVSDKVAQVYAEERDYVHSASWLTLRELRGVDYDTPVPSRYGSPEPLRDLFGPWFFAQVDALATLGGPDDVRIVFWFDN